MMTEGQKTVIYSWLHVISSTLQDYDMDSVSFLKKWDLDYQPSTPHDARVPTLKVFRALSHAQQICNDDAFGIKLAKNILPTMFHGLATAAIASENLLAAANVITQHFHLICESMVPSLFKRDNQLIICFNSTDGIIPPACIYEAFMAALIHGSEVYMGKKSMPVAVHFTRKAPFNEGVFSNFFGDNIHYEEAANYMVMDLNDLQQPVLSHNPQAKQSMLELIGGYQQKREQKSFSEMVEFCIKAQLYIHKIDLRQVATALNMSERSLQLNLQNEGVTFREITERVQWQVSNTLMITSDISVENLAQKLGYHSASNFCRAYKKWSGKTPNQYRSAPYALNEA